MARVSALTEETPESPLIPYVRTQRDTGSLQPGSGRRWKWPRWPPARGSKLQNCEQHVATADEAVWYSVVAAALCRWQQSAPPPPQPRAPAPPHSVRGLPLQKCHTKAPSCCLWDHLLWGGPAALLWGRPSREAPCMILKLGHSWSSLAMAVVLADSWSLPH